MKRFRLAVLTGILCLGVTACGSGSAERAAADVRGAVSETTAAETVAETAAETAAAETAAKESGSGSESEAAPKETAEETQNIYADMDGIIFGFLSGVGAWETTLEVEPDGSFKGQFYDADMGVTGEGYENGTLYECTFTGKFSKAEKVDETSWSAKVEELNYEKEKNGSDHYIEDGTMHIMTGPYGLSLGCDITIYTPDKKVSELSEGFMSWMLWKIPDDAKTLEGIGIYNVTDDCVFYPDTYAMEAAEKEEAEKTGETTEISGAYHYLITPGEKRTDEGEVMEWTVEVTGGEGIKETLIATVDETSIYFPTADGIFHETDVNFDGHPDVLLFRGVLGAQGIDFYDCWISDGSRLVRCEGFEEIPDPYVDTENKLIYGHVRDGAAAYYDLQYRVDGTKVVQTEETRYVYSEEAQDYLSEKK